MEQRSSPLQHLDSDHLHSPVKSMEFATKWCEDSGTAEPQRLVACYENGTAMLWMCSLGTGTQIHCGLDGFKNADLLKAETTGPWVCFASHGDDAEVVDVSYDNKSHRIQLCKSPSISSIACIAVDNVPHILLAAASRSGVITIHDLTSDERVMQSGRGYRVNHTITCPAIAHKVLYSMWGNAAV